MTIDEAIRYCEEMAEQNDLAAGTYKLLAENNHNIYERLTAETNSLHCAKCAAVNKQLAEWLTELKEAKRLLKAAVEDFKIINSDILTCKYCRWYSEEIDECTYYPDDVPCERICGWKHEAEALKLIGGSTDEHS